MSEQEYKAMSIREFTKAAEIYDSGHAGLHEMCKDDCPPVLEELNQYPFQTLLDVGCGTGPMIELLLREFPDKHCTGIDLTLRMIEAAQAKHLANAKFLVGDSEHLPFEAGAFDVVICTNSFHHDPNPQAFMQEAARAEGRRQAQLCRGAEMRPRRGKGRAAPKAGGTLPFYAAGWINTPRRPRRCSLPESSPAPGCRGR